MKLVGGPRPTPVIADSTLAVPRGGTAFAAVLPPSSSHQLLLLSPEMVCTFRGPTAVAVASTRRASAKCQVTSAAPLRKGAEDDLPRVSLIE